MSSLPPPSYIDDGHSFPHRTPPILSRTQIANWVASNNSDVNTSAYTGSYYDDGADMLASLGRTAGFGTVDKRFYRQRKKKTGEGEGNGGRGLWNEDIQRAVAGDIGRSLGRVYEARGLEVRKDADKGRGIELQIPGKWGTFVIRGNDERVIVVDGDGGEFDSGSHPMPFANDKKYSGKRLAKGRWVRARSSAKSKSSERDKKMRGKDPRDLEIPAPPLKELPRIPESEYEYICEGTEEVKSPTRFFMTGGMSGWPSREASPVASLKKGGHTIHSSPGAWPPPAQSDTPTTSSDDGSSYFYGTEGKLSTSWQGDFDNMSTRTASTYRPPMVEDAAGSSSDVSTRKIKTKHTTEHSSRSGSRRAIPSSQDSHITEKQGSQGGWPTSVQNSPKLSHCSAGPKDNDSWTPSESSNNAPRGTSVQNWVAGHVSVLSDASSRRSRSHKSRKTRDRKASHSRSDRHSVRSISTSEAEWDGYERPKTMSEISVVGSERSDDWGRSKPASEMGAASKHHSQRRRDSRENHRSGQSIHSSSSDWNGSRKADVGGWDEETSTDTRDGAWDKNSRTGSRRSGSRYANGFDEDNKTYLNATWDGVAVRVASRRTSVAGWDN